MTPIINPWMFYWMNVADILRIYGVVSMIISIIILITWSVMLLTGFSIDFDIEVKKATSITKGIITVVIVSSIITVFMPSKETITKMIVAQNVTYERVETTTDTVQAVYDDIMALFEKDKESERR